MRDKKLHENVLIFTVSYKTLIDPKHLLIRFDKIEEFIRIHDETKYLTLFGFEKLDLIYDRIRDLISLKSDITYFFFPLSIQG